MWRHDLLIKILFSVLQTFRFRPFRKVAKSARINLNRYWGLLSQTSSMKPSQDPVPVDHSYEEEQNRINEMLEAQNAAAISDNARNFFYENSPEFYRRHSQSPSLSSVTSSSQSSYYDSSEDVMSIVSGGSLV